MTTAAQFLWLHPAVWPAVLFGVFAPVHVLRADPRRQSARFTRREATVLVLGGAVCLCLFAFSLFSYLFTNTFQDLWESLTGSIASVFLRGGDVYPALSTEERYASPYGPFLYLTLGLSHWMFGASAFTTKLPCAVAALLAVAIFWLVVRRQSQSASVAFIFAAIEAALLLAFRIQAFWPKPDGLILVAVTGGLVCALRNKLAWQLLFGACLGAAIDLKPHAAAYFLPLLALGYYRGWRGRAFAVALAATLTTAALPFASYSQFSLTNYINLLQLTMREGFSIYDALDFVKWVGLFAALVFVVDRWQQQNVSNIDLNERACRLWFRIAILVGLTLAAVPGAAVGAGPRHAMPFLPLILYDVSRYFTAGAVRASGQDRPLWRLIAYSALASFLLIATQTSFELVRIRTLSRHPGAVAEAEVRRILEINKDATILMGAGSDEHISIALLRHEIVFAGNPIGIDLASVMDYDKAGVREPNLPKLACELKERHRRPLLWIVPHGEPFSVTNIYDHQPLFSKRFRHDFLQHFRLREHTPFFDVYAQSSEVALVFEEHLAGIRPRERSIGQVLSCFR